ncbi:MAG: acyl-CoA thioesterase [Bacteroidales bacterium]|jgi:acyl-CoA thioester hydrolase|nr:acyl-CoA thioesterase [Bacteroidales bacterium]
MAIFKTSFPVRYYETDQMAVVHHSNYIRYFEIARDEMMVQLGFPIEKCEKELGVLVPIVSVECHFRHPARMGDVLTATAEVNRVPMAKMVIKQTVYNQDGVLCAEGSVTLGFLNKETFMPVRCPEPVTELFEKFINA